MSDESKKSADVIPATVPASPVAAEPKPSEDVAAEELKPLTDADVQILQTGPPGTSVTHFERTGPAPPRKVDEKVESASMDERARQLKRRRGLRSPEEKKSAESPK